MVEECLPFRPPLNAEALLSWLAARAVPGVEEIAGDAYRRSMRLPKGGGVVEATFERAHVRCRLWLDDARDAQDALARWRRLLDLDVDPHAVAEHLRGDALIGPLVDATPGLRVAGTVDGAELAVRAVLGQQISVPAARTAAGRLAEAHGERLERPRGAVTALFPAPETLAALDPTRLAMPRARATALVGLCRALADGELRLAPGADRADARRALLALPGIGPWTAGYVAMRALRDPDVFLVEDLGVRHALRRLGGPDDPREARAIAAAWAAVAVVCDPASVAGVRRARGLGSAAVTGFGPEHLPYGVFRRAGEEPRVGVRLRDGILDLAALAADGPLDEDPLLFFQPSLNAFMAAGREAWRRVREALRALTAGPDAEPATVALDEAQLLLPIDVGDYADFYSSLDHATNVGRIFRPDAEPLAPNWRHMPIGYHGRSGTVVVSGTPIARPCGQRREPGDDAPVYGPSVRLDIELELGFVIGTPSALGEPVTVDRALEHVFGVLLVNDWSARDLQSWEYRPLGPFLAKSFATSMAAWVTPLDAIRDRRVDAPAQEPAPLDYLREEPWAFDLALEIELNGTTISRTNARHLYWSAAQQLAHMTVNGASVRTGDLFASGTISGPRPDQRGCLLELTWNGAEPLTLADGSTRSFLEDGDEVVLRGRGGHAIALGEVRGRIEPAR